MFLRGGFTCRFPSLLLPQSIVTIATLHRHHIDYNGQNDNNACRFSRSRRKKKKSRTGTIWQIQFVLNHPSKGTLKAGGERSEYESEACFERRDAEQHPQHLNGPVRPLNRLKYYVWIWSPTDEFHTLRHGVSKYPFAYQKKICSPGNRGNGNSDGDGGGGTPYCHDS